MRIENADIKVNFYDDVLANMTAEQKRDLAKMLVWDDDILEDVVNDLTENLATSHYNSNIHKARLQMRGQLPEMAQQLVAALLDEVARAKAEENRMNEWAWKLYHLIVEHNNELHGIIPAIPDWQRVNWDEMRQKAKQLLESRPVTNFVIDSRNPE